MTVNDVTTVQSTETNAISDEVVFAVAEATGTDMTQLEPLYNVIDPDALDQLFQTPVNEFPRSDGRVVFTMEGCEVTVHASGEVVVTPPSDP